MPHVTTDDGVNLHYEEVGEGTPVVFVHEFAGDWRSWEPQMRYFGRRYRCVAYNARGYPPSDVPASWEMYSQDRARLDILAVLDGLGIDAAHIVGLSMGGFATLHFGMHHADRALSLVVAGCGYGADADKREQFKAETMATADKIERDTMDVAGKGYALGPTRVQYQNKDPRGWAEFEGQLREHSTLGSANTMRGVQSRRPSLYDLAEGMRAITVPTLIVNGDEDEPCLDVGLFMKRNIPSSGLVIYPNTGHTMNLEEPALFNQSLEQFFHQVEAGRWELRDPRSQGSSILHQDEK
jgi:pimeloyl-ACP methyl ester carboxylesterase